MNDIDLQDVWADVRRQRYNNELYLQQDFLKQYPRELLASGIQMSRSEHWWHSAADDLEPFIPRRIDGIVRNVRIRANPVLTKDVQTPTRCAEFNRTNHFMKIILNFEFWAEID